MKARPERSVNEPKEDTPPAQVRFFLFCFEGFLFVCFSVSTVKFSLGHSKAVCFKSIKAAHSDKHRKQPVRNFAFRIGVKF